MQARHTPDNSTSMSDGGFGNSATKIPVSASNVPSKGFPSTFNRAGARTPQTTRRHVVTALAAPPVSGPKRRLELRFTVRPVMVRRLDPPRSWSRLMPSSSYQSRLKLPPGHTLRTTVLSGFAPTCCLGSAIGITAPART